MTYVLPEQFDDLVPHEKPDAVDHRGAFADREWPQFRIEYCLKWTFSDWGEVHRINERAANADPYSDVGERIATTISEIFGYSFGQFLLDGGLNHQDDPRASAVHTLRDVKPLPTIEERGFEPSCEEYEAHEREVAERARDWVTVLSITKDDKLRPVVSDTGGLSFLIRKADLAERRFDRPWIVRS